MRALRDFLKGQLAPEEEHPDGRCVRIQLYHLAQGRSTGIASFPVSKECCGDDAEITEFEHDVLEAADSDAAARHGRQKYMAGGYSGDSRAVPTSSIVFLRDGGGDPDTTGPTDSEGATLAGVTEQLMRHNEANAHTIGAMIGPVMSAQAKIIERLTERLGKVEDQRFEVARVYETMLSEAHDRALRTDESKLKQRMMTEAFDKVSVLAPLVVNKMAGRRLLPEPESAANEVVNSLAESFTKEQIEKIAPLLKPEQFMAFLDLIKAAQEKREAREHEAQARTEAAS